MRQIAFLCTLATLCMFNLSGQDKTLSPYFHIKGAEETDAFVLKSTDVDVNISGVIADVVITQKYHNKGATPLEAIYVFPASTKAAVYDMQMQVGDKIIQAEIQEKEEARKNYEKAVKQGKRASLLEQERPNVFKMNVGNILAGDEITLVLKYTELLVPEEGQYGFVFPTVVGPRYAGDDGELMASATNTSSVPYLPEGDKSPSQFNLLASIHSGVPLQKIECSSHDVTVEKMDAGNAFVSINGVTHQANRDFVLNYSLQGKKIESGILLHEGEKENFFLYMLQPPSRVVPDEIPPREYIFIVDVSGSMSGYPLDISKELMKNLLKDLKPTDRFNVLTFASGSSWLRPQSIPASTQNVDYVLNDIGKHGGGGGTQLVSALRKAIEYERFDEDLARTLVIITDGYVNVERETFQLIENNLDKANVFSFGIGSSVNRYIIEGMAHVGKGEPIVITRQSDADSSANQFKKYIASPVLTQIKADFKGFDVYDVEPTTIPDLFAERPLLIMGKYHNAPEGSIVVRGKTGLGAYHKSYAINANDKKKNPALRYLWARERIKLLSDYAYVAGSADIKKQVTDLGLAYNLLTQYTSFVAIEKKRVRNKNNQLVTVKQPLELPKGVSNLAVGGQSNLSAGFDMGFETVNRIETPVSEKPKLKVPKGYTTSHRKRQLTQAAEGIVMAYFDKSLPTLKGELQVEVIFLDGHLESVTVCGANLSAKELKSLAKHLRDIWAIEGYSAKESLKFQLRI